MSSFVAVLYARRGSVYATIPETDVWDEARDARGYAGPFPVVAHPPCRGWGRFYRWAKVAPGELDLAFHALSCVRRFGGVLEHPAYSRFWGAAGLPQPGGAFDEVGGWSLLVNQVDWGHRALKPTWLYFCGLLPSALPARPGAGVPSALVEKMWRGEREATPPAFARWLIQCAKASA